MALKTVTATFTGAEDSVDVTWSGVSASHHISVAMLPTDGNGATRIWLTNHTAGGATVNTSARFTGTVKLTIVDAPTLAAWPTVVALRLAFPIGYSTEVNGGTPTVYNRALYIPSDVLAVTPRSRNALSTGGVGSSLTCNFAHYASDGSGNATGSAFSPGALLSQTVPGDGTDWNGGSHTITRGSDGKIVQCQSLAAGATVSCSVTPHVHGTYSASTSTVSPPPASSGSDPTPIAWNHYDIVTARPRWIFIGDSILGGVNTTLGFENSFAQQLAAAKDYAVCSLTLAGSTLVQWAAFGSTSAAWWADGQFNTGVGVWIQPGVNDVSGRTGAQMYGDVTTIVNHLRNDLGVTKIGINTIAPNNSVNETNRLAYNALVLANSLSLSYVADFAAKQNVGGLADNSTATSLFASYDSGDHLHWTDAGQTQAATMVEGML